MNLYAPITTTLATLAFVAAGGGLVLVLASALPGGRRWIRHALPGEERGLLSVGLVAAGTATAGSLYLSDVVGLVPCLFCWYQRIAMYPLVPVLAVAVWRRDPGVWRYGLPLSVAGLLLAAYHVSLQWNPALEVVACQGGAPCSGRYLAVFGFVSIPTMAGSVFLLLTGILLAVAVLRGGGASAEGAGTRDGSPAL